MPCKQQLVLKRSDLPALTQIQYIDFARLLAVEKGNQKKETNAFEHQATTSIYVLKCVLAPNTTKAEVCE